MARRIIIVGDLVEYLRFCFEVSGKVAAVFRQTSMQ